MVKALRRVICLHVPTDILVSRPAVVGDPSWANKLIGLFQTLYFILGVYNTSICIFNEVYYENNNNDNKIILVNALSKTVMGVLFHFSPWEEVITQPANPLTLEIITDWIVSSQVLWHIVH